MKDSLFHIEDFDQDLRVACFEFFFWFSRFEYALKAAGLARAGRYGEAQVSWQEFVKKHAKEYMLSDEAQSLLKDPPQTQTYLNGNCGWDVTNIDREKTELGRVLLVVKTIRNNLFHGGKAGQKDWDDPIRNLFLLRKGKGVIDELATVAGLESDYFRIY